MVISMLRAGWTSEKGKMRNRLLLLATFCVFSNILTALIVLSITTLGTRKLEPCRADMFREVTSPTSVRTYHPFLSCPPPPPPLLTHSNKTSKPCNCDSTSPSTTSPSQPLQTRLKTGEKEEVEAISSTQPSKANPPQTHNTNPPALRTIFMITPTYKRLTQKSDLTSVCLTVMNVQNIVWIVIEDATEKSELVGNLLSRCKVFSVHLNAETPKYYKDNKWKARGVLQRNAGLTWIREHHTVENCSGIVYFGDDDNSYDLRVFEKMRETEKVSVWPVAYSGGVKVEGPICKDGKINKWHHGWGATRPFPIDMAGFAVNLCLLMEHPKVVIGRDKKNKLSKPGYLESNLLEQLIDKKKLECRGPPNEVIVWHVKTEKPDISREGKNPTDTNIEV